MILKVDVYATGYSEYVETPKFGLLKINSPEKVSEEIKKCLCLIKDHGLESVSKNFHDDFSLIEDYTEEFDPNKDYYDQVEEFETFATRYDDFKVCSSSICVETFCKHSGQGFEYSTLNIEEFLSILESGEEFRDLTRKC